ncbi:hypothetical protein [Pseudomonas aeruginosa]|uniref:hypothetical protein n=1 Tax=Pseudomonas aeruginosa TaxID=287 RepID=UPI000F8805FF|nr:hypothetical protein [Pseudomonas aeruginosa]ELC3007959.1 hypothetical protein [Pseudomonas aeruginosa]ELF6908487.1 hypothetical protein [Pseudomonas aeruginosa]EME5143051.1 hypothetical protein [Pseudomonas aeruginosa]MBG4000572.1 hypothetical protein [Pseudomonas aeruginosa]MBG4297036.1 hypothetical protein [Pseudomonas aeruginosa]
MTKKPEQPRYKRAEIVRHFNGEESITRKLTEDTAELILHFARMALCDEPLLRADGRRYIKMVAEFCVAGQFYLADQLPKAKKNRGTIDSDQGRTSATEIIERLAHRKDALGDYLKPNELWSEYISVLDELGLSPISDKLEVTFEGGKTSKDSFRATLSRVRRQKNR